jgi:ABC-2 type transport system ATP-binding protein
VLEEPLEVKKRIGYLPENPPLYYEMTVEEYLKFVCEIKKVPKAEREEQVKYVVETVMLDDVKKRLIKNLSKGYRQRVGLAQALIGKPEVLILDEPTVGLDPKQIIEIRELIKKLGEEHTIILSSHILPEVNAVCSRVVIINKGKIVAVDTPENLTQNLSNITHIEACIEGETEKVSDLILSIDGVRNVSVIENLDEATKDSKYLIESNEGTDVRKDLFYALAKKKYPLLELGIKRISLEDVFLKLTKTEEEV